LPFFPADTSFKMRPLALPQLRGNGGGASGETADAEDFP
jgi:hypothetical protein